MKVRIKKLKEIAVIPQYAHTTDAGLDLVATSKEIDEFGNIVYGTGIAVEIPQGYVGLIFPRSSICKKEIALTNCVGVIDSGYRGEILCKFKPTLFCDPIHTATTYDDCLDEYQIGDRIAQMIIMPYPTIELEEVDCLSYSDRGVDGYGSTGDK